MAELYFVTSIILMHSVFNACFVHFSKIAYSDETQMVINFYERRQKRGCILNFVRKQSPRHFYKTYLKMNLITLFFIIASQNTLDNLNTIYWSYIAFSFSLKKKYGLSTCILKRLKDKLTALKTKEILVTSLHIFLVTIQTTSS